MSNYTWARNVTLTLEKEWQTHPYHRFMQNATQAEFLESQIPFYFAVAGFPEMLLKLASQCLSSEQRALIIKNLWDEHGQGDASLFHTHTFLDYLCSLSTGDHPTTPEQMLSYAQTHKHPAIQKWIRDILENNLTASELASYLAGIEYAYAIISKDIAKLLDSYSLLDKQKHYHNHSEWDWLHGEDLLITADLCDEHSKKHFKQAQAEFLTLFSKMTVLTIKELDAISQNPISFFFSREDSQVELNALSRLKVDHPSIFTICSGGEHIIHYLQQKQTCNIMAFDSNPNQLQVLRTKLKLINEQNLTELDQYLQTEGKFEQLFTHFRSFLNLYEYKSINKTCSDSQIAYASQQVFNDTVLSTVFGENAVKYSKGHSFINHFKRAIRNGLFDQNSMTDNVVYGHIPLDKYIQLLNPQSTVTYMCDTLQNYSFDKQYDIIDLSNVGDWMSQDMFIDILKKAKQALNEKGILIVRRLLGNYSLKQVLETLSFDVECHEDDTLFYSETVTATMLNY